MVSDKKKKTVKELKEELKKWPVVGVINMHKLPARQLFFIKNKLAGKAKIRMIKKRLISLALKESGQKNMEQLTSYMRNEPALLLTTENPFRIARTISQTKSSALAKAGDIASRDIVVPAGPTSLMPGPVIGEFQKAKIPAGVENGKIAVKQDTLVAKEGEEINKDVADILAKLGIEPIEIGLNLIAIWERGDIYSKDVLFIPPEQYLDDIKAAAAHVLNLTVNINYPTPENIRLLVSKAGYDSRALATEAGILNSDTVGPVLAKAQREFEALKTKVENK